MHIHVPIMILWHMLLFMLIHIHASRQGRRIASVELCKVTCMKLGLETLRGLMLP